MKVSESSVPDTSPHPVRSFDPAGVRDLSTELRSTAEPEGRIRIGASQPGLRSFNQPVAVKVDEDDCYVASDVLGAVYGAGSSESEALADFYRALDEHLRFLREHSAELHPRLERQLAALERLFPDR